MSNIPESAGSSPDGLTKVKSTAKDVAKVANNPEKKEIKKVEVFPTIAVGDTSTGRVATEIPSADFYRNGKYNTSGDGYEISPKTLEPMENQRNNTASIRIFGKKPTDKVQKDLIPPYTKFILERVEEGRTERSQIVETFGDFYVFMFGERPPVYNFSGTLINAWNVNWVSDFSFMYDNYLRGTRCVEQNAVTILTYGGKQIEGLILNTSSQLNATTDIGVPFSFSVVVFDRRYFRFSDDMGYLDAGDGTLAIDEGLRETLLKIAGPEGLGTSTPSVSAAQNAAKSAMAGESMSRVVSTVA